MTTTDTAVEKKATRRKSTVARRSSFSAAEKKAICEYVKYLQGVVRVSDWNIEVEFEGASSDALADITSAPFQKWATLRLGPDFLDLSPRMQTQTLIHEVAHCVHFAMFDALEGVCESAVAGKRARRLAGSVINGHIESITDHWADVLLDTVCEIVLPVRR